MKQDEAQATFAHKISKGDGFIDFFDSADDFNKWRTYPLAWNLDSIQRPGVEVTQVSPQVDL